MQCVRLQENPLTAAGLPRDIASMVLRSWQQGLQPAANQELGEYRGGRWHGKERRWRAAPPWGRDSRSRKTGVTAKKTECLGQ